MRTVNEVTQDLAKIIAFYSRALEQYNDEQFNLKPSEKAWSVGQLYEHLVSSAGFFLYQVKNCLTQRKGSTEGGKNEFGEKAYQHNSFPPIKIEIPEGWRGPEPVAQPREAYREALAGVLAQYQALAEQVQQDGGAYKTQHLAWGMLRAGEWFQLGEMHFRHHLRQIKDLNTFLGIALSQ
ncbi:MAG TPA: DinB family protein [Microscillaceae bacterium]|jgi:hypothetical protein|nr:DinB family protein [Microscillaceae bacterium]